LARPRSRGRQRLFNGAHRRLLINYDDSYRFIVVLLVGCNLTVDGSLLRHTLWVGNVKLFFDNVRTFCLADEMDECFGDRWVQVCYDVFFLSLGEACKDAVVARRVFRLVSRLYEH